MISKREFLKLIAGSFAVFLPWKDIYGETDQKSVNLPWYKQDPESLEHLIEILEKEFPLSMEKRINMVKGKYEDYIDVKGDIGNPIITGVHPFTTKVDGSFIMHKEYIGNIRSESKRKLLKSVLNTIRNEMHKNNKKELAWRVRPESREFSFYPGGPKYFEIYTRVIFI